MASEHQLEPDIANRNDLAVRAELSTSQFSIDVHSLTLAPSPEQGRQFGDRVGDRRVATYSDLVASRKNVSCSKDNTFRFNASGRVPLEARFKNFQECRSSHWRPQSLFCLPVNSCIYNSDNAALAALSDSEKASRLLNHRSLMSRYSRLRDSLNPMVAPFFCALRRG